MKYRDTHVRQALSMCLTRVPKSLVRGEQLGGSAPGSLGIAWESAMALYPSVPPLHFGMVLADNCLWISEYSRDVIPCSSSKLGSRSTQQVPGCSLAHAWAQVSSQEAKSHWLCCALWWVHDDYIRKRQKFPESSYSSLKLSFKL